MGARTKLKPWYGMLPGLKLDGEAQQQVGGVEVEVAKTKFGVEGQVGEDIVIGPWVNGLRKGTGYDLVEGDPRIQAEHIQGIAKLEIPIYEPCKATARRCNGQIGKQAQATA